ncbi:putative rossmann-like alpha/beta/alpha sandwich protein [Medicago truncatula]|nr:putative rossmann-like alpha/beta/alpha sandwich protein [Medicago truncatula]
MDSPPSPSCIIVACDATRDRNEHDIKLVIDHVHAKDIILSSGDRLLVLCILHKVSHPMGYQTLACPESFAGTNFRAMEEEVRKKVHVYANELLSCLEDFEIQGVTIDIQVTAGFPIRQIILQEVKNYNASWIVLDRYLRRDMRFHLNKIPCNVALVKDDLSVDIWRSQNAHDKIAETKPVYSLSKFVSLSDCHSMQDIEQSIISCKSYPNSLASSDSSGTIKSYSMHSYATSSLHSRSSSKHEKSG